MICIAIDDEPMALEAIEIHIAKLPFMKLAATFVDAFKGLDYLHSHPVDLVFLDIQMPDITGLQLSQSLGANSPMLIFTTAYSQYAVASYEVSAVDYLLKPIEFSRFLTAANKAYQLYTTRQAKAAAVRPARPEAKYLFIKSGNETYKIHPYHILYVESDGNYITFLTEDQSIRCRLSMEEAMTLLPADQFIRIHRSFIISFYHLDKVESHQVMIQGKAIPLGALYRKDFLDFIDQHKQT